MKPWWQCTTQVLLVLQDCGDGAEAAVWTEEQRGDVAWGGLCAPAQGQPELQSTSGNIQYFLQLYKILAQKPRHAWGKNMWI